MSGTQRIVIENRRGGCGCGSLIALLLITGLAIHYWYIAAPLAIAAGGAWLWTQWRPPTSRLDDQYECPRCHGGITKGTTTCMLCGWQAP